MTPGTRLDIPADQLMSDNPTPDPSTPLNPDLIRKYFDAPDREWGLKALTSLFDFHRRQTQRSEDLSRAYLAQMIRLQGSGSVLKQPMSRPAEGEGAPHKEPGSLRGEITSALTGLKERTKDQAKPKIPKLALNLKVTL